MVLLTGAGLMTRSVRHLMSINRGFDVVGKMAFWIDLPKPLQTAKPRQDFVKRMEERLRSLAGIRNVGASNTVPLAGMSAMPLTRPDGKVVLTGPSPVSPSFLRGMGMKLKNGRWLPSHPEGSPGVMLINQSMADQWFGKEDPVGRIIAIEPGSAWEVIGVVGNIREELRSNEAKPQFYFPIWQANRSDVITLMVDASLQPSAAFIQSIRKAIHEVDPRVGVRMPIELEKAARWQMNDERFTLFVLGLISSVSTLLAVLGLFSVMAYSVSQRMKDFGIRLALGAPARQLFLSVLSRGFMLGALGIVLGLLGSWVLTRYIKSLLYETSPLDPLVYSATALLMLLAVCLACWMPAHKAASADPSHLLRME
jgi:putative ABC transport system permease protein